MNKKLKLSKETLKTLSPKLLAQVLGGTDLGDTGWGPSRTDSDPYMQTDACNRY